MTNNLKINQYLWCASQKEYFGFASPVIYSSPNGQFNSPGWVPGQEGLQHHRAAVLNILRQFLHFFFSIFFFPLFVCQVLFKFIYLFLFMAVLGLRFCARAFSSCGKRGPLFLAVRRPLTIAASLVAQHRLQTCRLSNCGSRAQLLRGMWDLPRSELELMSLASAGGFSTTAPPGKPRCCLYIGSSPTVFAQHLQG